MNNPLVLSNDRLKINSYIFNLAAIVAIYFVPVISHLLSFPLYLVDPMRIIIMLSVIHTSNRNAYLIALTLPLFSFIVSSHPVAAKSLLITTELLLNIWLFYQIYKMFSNKFVVMFTSIIISKVYYYIAKTVLVSAGIIEGNVFSTPVYIQILVALLLSLYLFFVLRSKTELGDK